MTDELLDLADIASLYRCTRRHARDVIVAPGAFDPVRRVVSIKTKTEARANIPIGRIAARLLVRPPFTVGANEGSTLFSRLCRELLIEGLTFHDTRATAIAAFTASSLGLSVIPEPVVSGSP